MASDRTIDEIDATLLDILQYNARTTQAELAKAVGLAPSAVLERLRKLESKGIIKDYVALIDPHAVDRGLLAFVAVRTRDFGPDMPPARIATCSRFARAMPNISVSSCVSKSPARPV